MKLQLDQLHFLANMLHTNHVLKNLNKVDVALGLSNCEKRQNWYTPNEQTYHHFLDGLIRIAELWVFSLCLKYGECCIT
jgi:hypothetical protein